MGYSMSSETCR